VHTICTGDTASRFDLLIEEIKYNRITYSKATLPVKVAVRKKGKPAANTMINVYLDGKVIGSKPLNFGITEQTQVLDFEIEAGMAGFRTLEVEAAPQQGEADVRNNRKKVFIEVLDARRRIVVLAAFPHPDVGLIYNALSTVEQYEVNIFYVAQAAQAEMAAALQTADAVVLYQITAAGQDMQILHQALLARNTPAVYVLGQRSVPARVNQMNMPFQFGKLKGGNQEVFPIVNPDFSIFTFEVAGRLLPTDFPAVQTLFDVPAPLGETYPLLYRKIGNVETLQTLWTLGVYNGRRYALIAAEGIWKWALREKMLSENKSSFTEEILRKTLQFVAGREKRKRLRVEAASNSNEGEVLIFKGELYNPNLEKVAGQEISLRIKQGKQVVSEGVMASAGEDYRRDISGLSSGIYSYVASAVLNGENLSDTGVFIVNESLLEYADLQADNKLLERISDASGGMSVRLEDTQKLAEAFLLNPPASRIHEETETRDIIDLLWIFWVILLFAALEWGVRRYSGGI
jgi:hypothetical protein